ncbi:MAG: L-glutamate gamma-semialdehyde dehydrogenase [Caldisericia bacterium]|nr:L-glutamate gamma-semialdehyde dehydrogenase [Caldisericia bacterium]
MNSNYKIPVPKNEPIKTYAPGSPEKIELKNKLEEMYNKKIEIPLIINGEEVRTGNMGKSICPHDHKHVLAEFHQAGEKEIKDAIEASQKAWMMWSIMPWEERAAIFLRAAELLAGPYRAEMNAATMLCQSKNVYQSEIDSVAELVDFLRYNVYFMQEIYQNQPNNSDGVWNRLEYRPLEGFVYAITPFNFTSIGGNLPTAPAIMGNVSLWKPSRTAVYSNYVFMKILHEAGLPKGVVNFIPGPSSKISDIVLENPNFAGIHFTGSTEVFNMLWKRSAENMPKYKSYPRIVGETGGKDFLVVHKSANPREVATAIVRGAFEYQGQKCSANSRAYLPRGKWNEIWKEIQEEMSRVKMGDVMDFTNFINAVIDKVSFDKISNYIEYAKNSKDADIVWGGKCDDSKGYFVEPTIILTTDPHFKTMEEEIFGPVITFYLYEDDKYSEVLELCNSTSQYALTGGIFATEREAVIQAEHVLRNAAGNFYINDKTTGAVVGHQPFGGARVSGTNDKAGSVFNLLRWTSIRTTKECFLPAKDFVYPFMDEE